MERQDKEARLQVIRMIIANSSIENQEELSAEMFKAGFQTTQTMLSRDLKQLRISKVRTRSGRSVYALPSSAQVSQAETREEFNATKWRLEFSGNIAVVHTPPGHASLAAYNIDVAVIPEILGTVAGDDTIIIALAEGAIHENVVQSMQKILPKLKNML